MQALCFAPFEQDWLSWLALTPLISALWFSAGWSRREWIRKFLLGFTAGGVFASCTFYWIIHVSALGWILLALYLALYPAGWAVFVGACATPRENPLREKSVWLGSANNLRIAAIGATGWVAQEWLRSVVFTGFGWNPMGVALYRQTAMIQITAITGVAGLSFLIVMMNFIVVATAKRLRMEIGRHALRPHYDFSLTLALVALTFIYGFREVFQKRETFPLRVAAVQTNIEQSVRWSAGTDVDILESLIEQSRAAVAWQPDLLVWPESATPHPLLSDHSTFEAAKQIAESFPGDLLAGTVYFAPDGAFNSAAMLSRGATEVQFQHKQHLVPFGEYVPLRGSFPLFAWVIGDQVPSDFDPGMESVLLEATHHPVHIGALICFEDTLAYITRRFANQGANLFVNVTNDGWFNFSAASRQHLANAVLRCTETGIPMVRAANTGVTCFIDCLGRIYRQLEGDDGNTFVAGVLMGEIAVPTFPAKTFHTRHGEVFAYICLAVSGLAGFSAAAASVRRRRKSRSGGKNRMP